MVFFTSQYCIVPQTGGTNIGQTENLIWHAAHLLIFLTDCFYHLEVSTFLNPQSDRPANTKPITAMRGYDEDGDKADHSKILAELLLIDD